MNTSRNRLRTNDMDMGDSQEPIYDPFRAPTSSGLYQDIPSTGNSHTHTGVLDTASENEHYVGSAAGHTSSSHSLTELREGHLTTKPNTTAEKRKRFPKFKFSLTAPPPKPKPKQPGQSRPAVHVGGRGGAGNIKRIKSATPILPGDPNNPEKKAVPFSVNNPRAYRPPPEGETTNSDRGSPIVSRETAVPRTENARGGTGNLYNLVLEDGVSDRVVAHEDALIRQYREMQAEHVSSRARRGAVGNIKRSDDDADWEYSTSPQSGSPGPRDFGGRRGIIRNKSSGTNSSSGMSADIRTSVPDIAAHPNSQPYAPSPGGALGHLSPVLEWENADVLVARGYGAHLVRVGSGRRTNGGYGVPPGASTGNTRSGEPPGRTKPGAIPLPRLYIPGDAPPRSHQSGGEGRRPSVISHDALEGIARSRSQGTHTLDGTPENEPDRHFYSHGSSLSPSIDNPLSSEARDPQRPFRAPPLPNSQHGFEKRVPHQPGDFMDSPEDRSGYTRMAHYSYQTTLTSPTIVSPPTPSTVYEENPFSGPLGGIKGTRLHVANVSHFDEKSNIGHRVRESGADVHRRVDPELVGKPREDRSDTMYSDLFGGRGATYVETDSVNSRREGTPFSDTSSVLIPRRAPSDALSSMTKKGQNRPTNLQRAEIPLAIPTRPTSRPLSQTEEESLHCDELNMPLQRALSKMEKAILRRTEFGQNIDLSRIQLS